MMLLCKCPKCHAVVPINPLNDMERIISCAFCGFNDLASGFAKVDGYRDIKEIYIIKALSEINRRGVDNDHIDEFIESISNKYGLYSSTVVELINLTLKVQRPVNNPAPLIFSELKGNEVLLEKLLKDNDYPPDKRSRISIESSAIELKRYKDKLEVFLRQNKEYQKQIEELTIKIEELIQRLSMYESL